VKTLSLTAALLGAMVAGCATPPQVVNEAQRYLRGECLELFTSQKMGGYQHIAQVHVQGKAVFAMAESNGLQKCGVARSSIDLPAQGSIFQTPGSASGWEQLEAIAISRCEEKTRSIKVPCKIFARNNEIVWGKASDVGFK
jgi:hypothetical protein